MVTAGLQSFSSSNNDKQTVPEGYTFGWKSGGSNLPVTKSEHVLIILRLETGLYTQALSN